jgi:hypothetical protein
VLDARGNVKQRVWRDAFQGGSASPKTTAWTIAVHAHNQAAKPHVFFQRVENNAFHLSVDENRTGFLEDLVEFFRGHFSNCAKTDPLFDSEKSLRTNEARLSDPTAFIIAFIQWNGESVPVRAAGDLAKNQIRAWKIGNHQSRTVLFAAIISARKRYDNDFAGYRFDHAASSSGEFQSRPRTDSLSSAPLNDSSRACSGDSLPIDSSVLIKQRSHSLP